MKKQLLSLVLAAALAPAFNANAQTLTEVWKYQGQELNGRWDADAPDWSSTDAIKKTSCTRFATGRDGRMYTLNMKTMSIAEISADGMKDLYKLPALQGDEIYGTAISMDEAGNFLIGHNFTKAPESSQIWSIYCPETGATKHFNLGYPDNMSSTEYTDNGLTSNTGIGRIDCVGRVLGDLTDEAAFYIAPNGSSFAYNIRFVFSFGGGDKTLEYVDLTGDVYCPTYLGSSTPQNIVQPAITSIYDYGDTPADNYKTYILCSGEGGKWDVISAHDSSKETTFCKAMQTAWRALPYQTANNGFDTFVLDGHRYFVHSYIDNADAHTYNKRPMDIAVFNELGAVVATWKNSDYAAIQGYNSIIAQPMPDGTALIHVYVSNDAGTTIGDGEACGAAAVLRFALPSEDEKEGTASNPIRISTVDDFLSFSKKCIENEVYVELENNLDLTGVEYNVPFSEATAAGKAIHFDGKNHVIRNLKGAEGVAQNASVFGAWAGSIKNLGVENIDVNVAWYCTGGLVGATIGDTEISNCYSTGSAQGAASGGLVGSCNAGTLTITDCYTHVATADQVGGHSAGLVGRANTTLVVNNAYASGAVYAKKFAAGIVNVNSDKPVTLNNVIAWNPTVDCGDADGAAAAAVANGEATLNNVLIFDGMQVNKTAVSSGTAVEILQSTATSWAAYNNELADGMPILAWQDATGAGISDIVTDSSDAPAVYYNLQGIKVANPENGIYIVRRGNKVSKEIIR